MKTEYEVRFLDINVGEFEKKLGELGAELVGDWLQVRFVYDFIPKREKSWIRLRTNGEKATLCIKQIKSDTVDGTEEIEVEVSDFYGTAAIMEKLGFVPRGRQESKRKRYMLDGVEIDIDTWPVMPSYVEIEGANEDEIKAICAKLELDYGKACTLGILDIAKKIYKLSEDGLDNVSFN